MTKIHLQSTYSDIVSDGGLDPRNEYEKKFKQKPLTDEIIDDIFRKVMNKHAYITEGLIELRREYARAVERAHGIGEKDE